MFQNNADVATNARRGARVWMVLVGLVLQMRGIYLRFGGLLPVWRSKCGEFISRLEGGGTTVCRAGRGSERLILQGFWGELGSMRAFPENFLRKIFKILEIGIFYGKRALI